MRAGSRVLAVGAFTVLLIACAKPYRLPQPDDHSNSSPPQLQGEILHVESSRVTLKSAEFPSTPFELALTSRTHFFTVFGETTSPVNYGPASTRGCGSRRPSVRMAASSPRSVL